MIDVNMEGDMPKTRIICTLGPASDAPGQLLKMMRAGMDVVRLNFSHGKIEEHERRIKAVRALNKKYRRRIRVLGDLEGYRIRIGRLKDGKPVELKKRQQVWLTPEDIIGEGSLIPFDYTGPLGAIKEGQAIYIDDGNIALVSEGVDRKALRAKVVVGGALKPHKGVNIPDVRLSFKGLTSKDKVNLLFCMAHEVDFIAQSFVRSSADILALKDFIKGHEHAPRIIAKIENREG